MRVLIAGCGYVGLSLGTALVRQGHDVFGVRRTPSLGAESAGIKILLTDITDPHQCAGLGHSYDWVVNCAAVGGGGEAEYRSVYLRGNANLLEWIATARRPAKYVYTSSTSVYGQEDGSVVDETSPVEPSGVTGKVLVEAENLVLREGRERGVPTVVLRLAGIYGPGRGYWFKQFVSGEAAVQGTGERVLNMIHREDVAGAIVAALVKGRPGEIYNVVDDEPVTQLAFFEWLAKVLGRPLPSRLEEPDPIRKRGSSNKRVSNRKLKTEVRYQLQFPTYREGYASEVQRLLEPTARSSANAE